MVAPTASFQGPAARGAWRGVERGPSSGVDAALGLVAAGPATGAGVLARCDGAGAGRAADGAVAQLEQRVDRDLVLGDVGVDDVLRAGGERGESAPVARGLPVSQLRVRPGRSLVSTD